MLNVDSVKFCCGVLFTSEDGGIGFVYDIHSLVIKENTAPMIT